MPKSGSNSEDGAKSGFDWRHRQTLLANILAKHLCIYEGEAMPCAFADCQAKFLAYRLLS